MAGNGFVTSLVCCLKPFDYRYVGISTLDTTLRSSRVFVSPQLLMAAKGKRRLQVQSTNRGIEINLKCKYYYATGQKIPQSLHFSPKQEGPPPKKIAKSGKGPSPLLGKCTVIYKLLLHTRYLEGERTVQLGNFQNLKSKNFRRLGKVIAPVPAYSGHAIANPEITSCHGAVLNLFRTNRICSCTAVVNLGKPKANSFSRVPPYLIFNNY